jgi:hypothetical protein
MKKKATDADAIIALQEAGYVLLQLSRADEREGLSFDRTTNRISHMRMVRLAAPKGSALYKMLEKDAKSASPKLDRRKRKPGKGER